uniref:ADH N n=1 Tax=Tremella fuciformis TaxID=64657 RepID=D5KY28_9TREE|nr:ADH N [Tremella fuciformis]
MDILQREGKYPLPPKASKTILGVEFSGIVSALGEGSSRKEGDEVFGLAYGGAYAEYIVLDEKMVLPKPKELSWVQAAALPEAWMTAYQALFVEGNFQPGQNALIHAGASGVGIAAIQLALRVGGADKVFTTCGTDEKVKFLQKLGPEDKLHVITYRTQKFDEEIKKVAPGVDQIVDFIGRDYFNQNLSVLRQDGIMILLAFLSGAAVPEGASIAPILGKRLTIKGSTLRSRNADYQGKLLHMFRDNALPKIIGGEMSVEVHEVFPWTKVQEAHEEMEANRNSGKIVLEVTE